MEIWQYLLLLLIVLLGGGIGLYLNADHWRKFVPFLLSFSGAYLLGVVALDLIPETFSLGSIDGLGIFLLLGFMIQLLLENLSQGVEHGHIHAKESASTGYGLQVMIGLSLHAFLEGLPLSSGEFNLAHDHYHGGSQELFWGILMHKLPAAFALALLLRQSGFSNVFNLACLGVFALMSPLGSVAGELLVFSDLWQHRILAIVIGSLLHISTTILFEADSQKHHHISKRKLLTIALGITIAILTMH